MSMRIEEESRLEKVGKKSKKSKNDVKSRLDDKDIDFEGKKNTKGKKEFGKCCEDADGDVVEKVKTKRKSKKKNEMDVWDAKLQEIVNEELVDGNTTLEHKDVIDGEGNDHLTITKADKDEAKNSEEGKRKKTKKMQGRVESCGNAKEKVERKKMNKEKINDTDILCAGLLETINEDLTYGSTDFEDKDFIDGEGNSHLIINKTGEDEAKNIGKGERKKAKKTHDGENSNRDAVEKVERKKRRRDKNKETDVLSAGLQKIVNDKLGNENTTLEDKDMNRDAMEKVERKKRKRDENKDTDVLSAGLQKIVNEKLGNENTALEDKDMNRDAVEKVERKKRKRDKNKGTAVLSAGLQKIVNDKLGNENATLEDKDMNKKEDTDARNDYADKSVEKCSGIPKSDAKKRNTSNKKKAKSVENGSENPKSKGKSNKVRFSGQVEVFPISDDPGSENNKSKVGNLVHGKRFSQEEDEIIKEAIFNYIEMHGLGEEGLKMVLHCGSHSEVRNCWKEIGAALPYRPFVAIYKRAHVLFERDERRAWTKEEYELILKFQEEHGNDWKTLADKLGKNRIHVKDTWRRIKLPNMRNGHWSQDEYQTLFDLVNMDLQMKVYEEKRSKHGMLRDNISWEAISDRLSTRTNATCCQKWYGQLTSPMVADGKWADADDYRLVDALYRLDACCMEDVDWDNLIDYRSGDICRKRWEEMYRHIGQHGNKSFGEQVDTLAKRYCTYLIEAREAWDSKLVVP